jgi:type II secretory pathway predicted ATPase ExeA
MKDIIAFFGLKRLPFDKDIRSQDALDTPAFLECLARLDYIKRRGGGTMLLTGDPGVGKTIALRRFADSLNESLYRPVYTPLSTLESADLLRHINDKLGLPSRFSKSAVFAQIQREILDSREHKGRTIVLIIDEAHLLKLQPLQELRLLTNFKMDSFDPFILVLSGQSELKRTMGFAVMEPFAQRLSMTYHMPSLDENHTARYIAHHMKIAGAQEPIFSDNGIAAIFDVTYGIPRKIATVAEQALTYAAYADRRSIDADIVLKVKTGA